MKTESIHIQSMALVENEFAELYEQLFPIVANYLSKRGATYEQCQDIFQDAMILFYEKSREEEADIQNEEAYITGIAKHLWFRRFSKSQKWVNFEGLEQHLADLVDEFEQPVSAKILHFLELAGKKCMELLRAFYYQQHSLDQIANDYGFSGKRSATVQKYKCLEKVRDQARHREASYADFFE